MAMQEAITVPPYYNLNAPRCFDNSTNSTEIMVIAPNCGEVMSTLNKSGQEFIFSSSALTQFVRFASPKTGIRTRIAFKTQSPGPDPAGADAAAIAGTNLHTADTTLSSNAPMHLLSKAEFKLGTEKIESVENPGLVTDIYYHLKGTEVREDEGQLFGYIPDTSLAADSNLINNFRFNAEPGNHAATAAAAGVACTAKINPNYNSGYVTRKELYNLPVANADTVRYAEFFTPLSAIFGFCSDCDIVFNLIGFNVTLTRDDPAKFGKAVFGAANTNILLGRTGAGGADNETGICNLQLEVEIYNPRESVGEEMKEILKGNKADTEIAVSELPLRYISFLSRKCKVETIYDSATAVRSTTEYQFPRAFFAGFKGTTSVAGVNTADQTLSTIGYQFFRNANLQNFTIKLDNKQYPNHNQDCNFAQNKYTSLYSDFLDAGRSLGGITALSMKDYKDKYTIIGINLMNRTNVAVKNSNFSYTFTRRTVPANNNDPNNPRDLELFTLVFDLVTFSIDFNTGTVTKL